MSNQELEEIIAKAVIATRRACQREASDAIKATEQRLLAYPILIRKIQDDKEAVCSRGADFDIVMVLQEDKQEAKALETAMSMVEKDSYYTIITKRFIEGKTLEEIAEEAHCDVRTVRRNKARLMQKMAVYLYGASAIK